MDWISTDPDRPGVFAFGQLATGIFAFGQLACGVIAIGQVARGVIAIGQVAVGVVAIGQAALGVVYAGGMVAVAARGFGICLKLFPKIRAERFERPEIPPVSSLAELRAGPRRQGWLLAEIEDGALRYEDADADVALSEEARETLREAAAAGHTHACVTVRVEERALPSDGGYREAAPREQIALGARMQTWREAPPKLRLEGPLTGAGGLTLRGLGLLLVVLAWWIIAGASVAGIFDRGVTVGGVWP